MTWKVNLISSSKFSRTVHNANKRKHSIRTFLYHSNREEEKSPNKGKNVTCGDEKVAYVLYVLSLVQ